MPGASESALFGPQERRGANEVLLCQIKKGRFVQIAGPLKY